MSKMRAFSNYDGVPEYSENSFKLPVGAYEVEIIRAEEQTGSKNSCALCLLFEISDGEYKGFFHNKFDSDRKSFPDKAKYKGVLRVWYPNGGEYDKNNEKRLKTTLERIKKSNNLNVDFSKEWDGEALKGCKVGMIFQEQEYNYEGRQGMTAQPYSVITLEALREGKFTLPKPKYLKDSSAKAGQADFGASSGDYYVDDLPF